MKLGICAPIDTRPLASYLDSGREGMPAGLGGTPVVALVRAALARGWQVTVFSMDPSLPAEQIAWGDQLKVCMGPYRPRHRARDLFAAERQYLAHAIQRERPDVVHAHWTYEFALGAMESGWPTVVTAHDRPLKILRWDHTPYRLVRTWMASQVARRARCLTAVSEPVASHFERYFPCAGPVAVIPNGLDPEWFENGSASRDACTFASVLTGWGPLKNGRRLLEAFQTVRDSLPGAQLLLFGHGHGPGEEAERWAQARKLSGGVRFLGQVPQPELRMRMRSAGVLVHPSLEESYSMVVAEAMASGIPVIASEGSGGIAGTLDGGRAALLTDAGSAEALAASMLRLATDPTLRLGLGQRAREAARVNFPVGRVLESYARLYAQVRAA